MVNGPENHLWVMVRKDQGGLLDHTACCNAEGSPAVMADTSMRAMIVASSILKFAMVHFAFSLSGLDGLACWGSRFPKHGQARAARLCSGRGTQSPANCVEAKSVWSSKQRGGDDGISCYRSSRFIERGINRRSDAERRLSAIFLLLSHW